jgi:hypothetical protein
MSGVTVGVSNQIDNSHLIQNQAQQAIIQTGQKTIIQNLSTPTYVIQQHKIPPVVSSTALKAISSTLAVEQSLTSNLVVRTISQNESPPITSSPKFVINAKLSSANFSTAINTTVNN